MTRVSTFGNYQSALLNLMSAQSRGLEAQKRLSTEKIADDLSGYGRGAETLTALKSAQSRITGFILTGEAVAATRSKASAWVVMRAATASPVWMNPVMRLWADFSAVRVSAPRP